MEKKVNELIEESCIACGRGEMELVRLSYVILYSLPGKSSFVAIKFHCNFVQALEKAKEAGRKERALCRQREQTAVTEQINLDLTYSVSKKQVIQIIERPVYTIKVSVITVGILHSG
jgi:intraflagellar transport protein 88